MNSFRLQSVVLLVALGLWGGYVPLSRADDEPALKLTARARIATIDPQTNRGAALPEIQTDQVFRKGYSSRPQRPVETTIARTARRDRVVS